MAGNAAFILAAAAGELAIAAVLSSLYPVVHRAAGDHASSGSTLTRSHVVGHRPDGRSRSPLIAAGATAGSSRPLTMRP